MLSLLMLVSASAAPAPNATVDALFSRYNDQTPGCAVGIMDAGHLTYIRAYGMANLQFRVPLTIDSVFSIASMSKQFTAMSIILLVEDRKISLDDDVRNYIPELPDYGHIITIKDLLHHTSGLKDLDQLLQFSGIHLPFDLMNKQMAWSVILRQRSLNFVPGEEYSYSDTNYFLLGAIVERVSGKTLAEFARQRIFDPLGMTHTEFRADASQIMPGLAEGYRKLPDGFHLAPDDDEILGDSGIFTTIDDLARWDGNFFDPRVGGRAGIDLMLQRRPLKDGSPNAYAAGLKVQTYRGLTMVEHAGDLPGYQSELVRFPEQGRSVAVLCNQRDDGSATALALGVARIALKDEFAAAHPAEAALPLGPSQSRPQTLRKDIERYAGNFLEEKTGNAIRFSSGKGQLSIVEPSDVDVGPLQSVGTGLFYRDGITYAFSIDGKTMEARQASAPHPAYYAHVPDPLTSPASLRDFEGEYYSADLDRTWKFSLLDNVLILHREGFHDETVDVPRFRDAFDSDLALLRFTRDARGRVSGLEASNYRLRKIHFDKLPHDGKARD